MKEDSYPAPDEVDLKKLQSLYEFSKRPETDTYNGKDHHEYNPWGNPRDYHGYDITDAKSQMSDIKVSNNRRTNTSGRHCMPFDFYTVHYKGYMQEGNKMVKVLDSRKVNDGKAISF